MPTQMESLLDDARIAQCARYVMEKAKYVIETFGERPPGSEGERAALELARGELAECCDGAVRVEPFPVAVRAFSSQQAVAGVFALSAVVAFFFQPLLAAILDLVAILVLYFQLIRYRLLLDPFFAKGVSANVYGSIKPKGPVRRRIIVSGHVDAASEFRFNYLVPKLFPIVTGLSLAGIAAGVLMHWGGAILWFISSDSVLLDKLTLIQTCVIPFIILGGMFNKRDQIVPGANDNLSGTFMVTGIGRQLREAGVRLEQTELVLAVLGSEEAGLRGAKIFAREHKKEFSDVETVVLVIDTVRDLPHMTVYNRDLNGTVKHDEEMCRLLQEAGKACGVDLPFGTVYTGSSDATAFTQEGWRATMLAAMDPHPADYYHTRRDNWDNMDETCLRKGIEVVATMIKLYDGQART